MSNAFNKLFRPPSTTKEWAETYCAQHGRVLPCTRCQEEDEWAQKRELTYEKNRAENPLREAAAAMWREVVSSARIDPTAKCVHGHYLFEFYCDVCRLQPVDPDYNPEVYRTEIDKALQQARVPLTGSEWKQPRFESLNKPDAERELITEGNKDLRDLMQVIDIEIWRASKKYATEMNESLAYVIAKNQSGKYLTKRIEEQTVESTDAEGRAIRIPRFESMDNKPLNESGHEVTTASEISVINAPAQGTDFTPIQLERLQALVATWHGQKRLVGEAMLRPNFSIHKIPGVPKSSAGRIRQAVLKDFKLFIDKGLQDSFK